LNGKIKIGLTGHELKELANCDTKVIKTSRRDLAYVLSKKLNGGTTVAGTLICAQLCGIDIFATGGIGGVHRDGENTLDISADLMEMGRSSVTVISSGIKSILDIPRTMEFLETQGVCVTTYQCPDYEFPAFYTRTSGVKGLYNFSDAADAAMCVHKSLEVGLKSSILIGVPVPLEFALDNQIINNAICEALKNAERAGIRGKEITPFILAAVAKITAGKSLQTSKFSNHSVAFQFNFIFYLILARL
jgi:pseudouridine-5'-phosphate glycosidase